LKDVKAPEQVTKGCVIEPKVEGVNTLTLTGDVLVQPKAFVFVTVYEVDAFVLT
jgi:hypothetical protein